MLLVAVSAKAQQEAMYTHYMYNTMTINPAYAGSRETFTATALHRSQWVGFEGAPTTQTLSLDIPVLGNIMGLGMSVMHDAIGPADNTSVFADYAYRIELNDWSHLSFGIEAGFNYYDFDLKNLTLEKSNDKTFGEDSYDMAPNIGLGVYYSTERFYAGLSIPKLVENSYNYSSVSIKYDTEQRHYYMIAGGLISLGSDLKLKPTGFMKVTKGAPIEGDLTAEIVAYNKFSAGLMGRSGDAIGALVGYYIIPSLCVGYSFDWSFVNMTGRYNSGTHEIVLRYENMPKKNGKGRRRKYTTWKGFCNF